MTQQASGITSRPGSAGAGPGRRASPALPGPAQGAEHVAMTVMGPVPSEDLGVTLMHEHLVIDLRPNAVQADGEWSELYRRPVKTRDLALLRRNPIASLDNCVVDDVELLEAELSEFSGLGGRTIVDLTPPALGRDVGAAVELARRTGLNVVVGCGHYTHACHEGWVAGSSVEALAESLSRELLDGIDGSSVRAGIIGEIGVSEPIHPDEARVLAAAAMAQGASGAAISLHVVTRDAHAALDILEREGSDLGRVIVGHQDLAMVSLERPSADRTDYLASLAARGATVALDCCGKDFALPAMPGLSRPVWSPSDAERALAVADLADAGHAERVLISHDVCHKIDLRRYGGFGYGHIPRSFTRLLRDVGLTDRDLHRLLVENPRRLLETRATATGGTS